MTARDYIQNLELTLMNSAFGYEYALQTLDAEGEFSHRAEQLRTEVDGWRDAYFMAREELSRLDADHLRNFETALQHERSAVFSGNLSLH